MYDQILKQISTIYTGFYEYVIKKMKSRLMMIQFITCFVKILYYLKCYASLNKTRKLIEW
jgi:hypothetical protein